MQIDAKAFDEIARTVFAPAYPLIAGQIIDRTGITHGVCLDIGCGGGYLGAALARITGLYVHFLDQSEDMLEIAGRTIAENGLSARAAILRGDVTRIPLPDATVHLAVSRGSVFFWEDLAQAFREIYRVLAPGGKGYIGGGFGSAELKAAILKEMTARNQGKDTWGQKMRKNLGPETRAKLETALKDVGIATCSVLHGDDIGLWAFLEKPA